MALAQVVMFSGGIGSWAAAKRIAAEHGPAELLLLFCDTKTEDEDTYRFLREAAANVGGRLVEIADGRNIWEVFHDSRYLGNSRADPCSRILKRELANRWLSEQYTPATVTVSVGIDWTEEHRFHRLAKRREPWRYRAPLCEPPYLSRFDLHDWAAREGLEKQRLYRMGAAHANCGGGCVKMGHGGFLRLLSAFPERYAMWEENEERLRAELGEVTILRDRQGGGARPLTLRELRERHQAGDQFDLFAIGGCGCFSDEE